MCQFVQHALPERLLQTFMLLLTGATITGCATTSAAAPRQLPTDLDELAWLAGHWIDQQPHRTSEEFWLPPAGNSMLGLNRTVVNGHLTFYEFLRLERLPDGIYYFASPLGQQPPTAFRLTRATDQRAEFENPTHDYPQRIIYWREPDHRLCACIEGQQNGQPQTAQWCWRHAPAEP